MACPTLPCPVRPVLRLLFVILLWLASSLGKSGTHLQTFGWFPCAPLLFLVICCTCKMMQELQFRLCEVCTGIEGVMRSCCKKTLGVLRENKESLITIIEVEPSFANQQLCASVNCGGHLCYACVVSSLLLLSAVNLIYGSISCCMPEPSFRPPTLFQSGVCVCV